MAFIGRERELAVLNRMYRTNGFQMLVLYGRRRIGKTTLLNEFARDKDPIFYTGIESKDDENLRELGNVVFSHFSNGTGAVQFRSYSDLLAYMTACVKASDQAERHLIILDEYPYLAENASELASVLQREIDHEWSKLNIMLILCGSSITFMEEEVLGEKSPLYGRRTGQMDLLPFDYLTSARFVPDYTEEEKAVVYGITGGVPKYLAVLDPARTLKENIEDNFFSTAGYFYEEPKNLLRQEFRDISLYIAILNAIGNGSTQVGEISGKTGFDTSKVSQALRKLEAVRVIEREIPILNEKKKKLWQYVLRDGMFRFWFRFVQGGTAAIERGYGAQYARNMVFPHLHEYMGPVFEKICQEYTFRIGMEGHFGVMLTRVGKWRGNDPVKRCPADIDVVGINENEKTAVIGECKFKTEHFGKEEYETLLDRARLVAPYRVERYLVFALSGVTQWVKDQAEGDGRIEIISMEQLYTPV